MPTPQFLIAATFFMSLSLTSAFVISWPETVGNVSLMSVRSNFVSSVPRKHPPSSSSARLTRLTEKTRNMNLMFGCRKIILCHKRTRDEDLSVSERMKKCGSLELLLGGLDQTKLKEIGDCDPKETAIPPLLSV